MNRFQYWTLNVIGLVLVALLLGHQFFARSNDRIGDAVLRDQAYINASRQIELTLDQLAKRIAKGSETDPQLKKLLAKYGLNVTLEADGTKKSYP